MTKVFWTKHDNVWFDCKHITNETKLYKKNNEMFDRKIV